jgi:hypothetical protein
MSFGSWWNEHITKPLQRLAPIIIPAIEIFAPEFIPLVGTALGATTTAGAISLGTAAISAGTSVLAGQSPEQAGKAAILGGIGGAASSAAQQATGLTGISGGAAGGAASGATQAALTGKDIGKAALKGGVQGGVTAAGQELGSFVGKSIDEQIAEQQGVLPRTDAVDYKPSTLADVGSTLTTQAFDKQVSDLIAKGSTPSQAKQAASAPPGQVSSVATGSQQSPTAAGAADVAMLDTSSPEGISGKAAKKGGKYPWGDPEGTTALKQEGQVV